MLGDEPYLQLVRSDDVAYQPIIRALIVGMGQRRVLPSRLYFNAALTSHTSMFSTANQGSIGSTLTVEGTDFGHGSSRLAAASGVIRKTT